MKKLIFKDIIRHHDLRFAQRVYPSVVFCNRIIEDEKSIAITGEFVKPILDACLKSSDIEEVFSDKIIEEFIGKIPKELLLGVNDIEDTVGFWLSY